ncbi:MAG: shikimate kinase, partial [Halanaerobiales bacterium]
KCYKFQEETIMIISLIGFMGTGKSSVGEKLSDRLQYQYLDTDDEIVNRAGISIPEIFEKYGEKYFRQLEKDALERVVICNKDIVLSTGGGIVLSAYNRRILKEKTTAVLLSATAEEIYSRVKDDSNRPLLDVVDPLQEIQSLLEKRNKYYNEFELKVETDSHSIDEIVDIIIEKTGVGPGVKHKNESIEEVSEDERTER